MCPPVWMTLSRRESRVAPFVEGSSTKFPAPSTSKRSFFTAEWLLQKRGTTWCVSHSPFMSKRFLYALSWPRETQRTPSAFRRVTNRLFVIRRGGGG